ncbi:MAG TPA: RIO1 family regulatory kinase/ATPase [Nakamurella sp.]
MPRFRLFDSYDPRSPRNPDDPRTPEDDADDLHDQFDRQHIDRRGRRPAPTSDRLPRVVAEGRSGHQTPDVDLGEDHRHDESPYSSYDVAHHGPAPTPDWLVTSLSARDTRLGVIKSGKEADVALLERARPGGPGCLLAVKAFRDPHHRLYHRDAAYQEGRRVRRSRETRAMAARTGFGRELLAGKWATAEFGALRTLWVAGARVPYPVQLIGSELMMEFIGDPDGTAAPRLASVEASTAEFTELWHDLVGTLDILAESGLTHGDLSPYNVLVDDTRCVVIDLPQVVDLVANPSGAEFLERDCRNIAEFFARRGVLAADAENLALRLAGLARP